MAKTKTKGTAKTVSDTPVPQPITISSTNPKIMADNIKKLEKAIKGSDDASGISYDNTESHLTATNAQAAIDEVVSLIGSITSPEASDVSYDNTSSGLTATDAQAAIDELALKSKKIIIEDVASLFTYDTTYNIWATESGALAKTGYTLVGIIVNATSTNSPAANSVTYQGGYGRIRGWDNTYTFIASAIWIKNS